MWGHPSKETQVGKREKDRKEKIKILIVKGQKKES
jgi:hypothetical protein